MSRLSLRELVFVLLLFGIVIGQWQLVLVPREERREDLLDEIKKKQGNVDRLMQVQAIAQRNLDTEISRLQAQISEIKDAIPRPETQHMVKSELTRRAMASHLENPILRSPDDLQDADVGPKGSKILEQSVSMVLKGNYMDFFSFLETIERMPRMFMVDRVQLRRLPMLEGRERETRGRVEVRLELKFYFMR